MGEAGLAAAAAAALFRGGAEDLASLEMAELLNGVVEESDETDVGAVGAAENDGDAVAELGGEVFGSHLEGGGSDAVESGDEQRWRAILKLEGTIDAYRLAKLVGDEARAEAYRKASLLAVEFLQELQYREGDGADWPDPTRAIGGTPYGFEHPIVRIEVPGHEVNAFLKVVEYMDLEEYPGKGL